MYFFDTETVGYHGPIVLLQYAQDDGPIILYNVWREPVRDTLDLIEKINDSCVGFNLTFDHFHMCQLYTVLRLLDMDQPPDIASYLAKEKEGRDGPCLKPRECLDIFLTARKGPYQSTMDRANITIKKVPTLLAEKLVEELNDRIQFKDIYFSRKSNPKQRWEIKDYFNDEGKYLEHFKNVELVFAPSSALKALAQDALDIDHDKILLFKDAEVPAWAMPDEIGWAPYSTGGDKSWDKVIQFHINHWFFNEQAKEYAADDVKYLRMLYKFFGCPPMNDDDSILACLVAASRWRGYAIDHDRIREENSKLEIGRIIHENRLINPSSPIQVKKYLHDAMTPTEQMVVKKTGKATLESVAKWTTQEVCDTCMGQGVVDDEKCKDCNEGLRPTGELHEAAKRAKKVLNARFAIKDRELFEKLLSVDRLHASFKIIGTLSGRMSGADGLNVQGINRKKTIRSCFPLALPGHILCNGDFDGFEVGIMDAVYKDPILHAELVEGKQIHALFGTYLFPGKTYEEIIATKGKPGSLDLYSVAKTCVFALFYGGNENTLEKRSNIPIAVAQEAYKGWVARYKVWGQERNKYFDMFCSMRQPDGIGTAVIWHDPADYIESLFGFKRYFTLENKICKTLFELAEKPPKGWANLKLRIMRRDRLQTVQGATRSALFAAAFAIQASNMRAAANHVIQSTGANTTKKLQVAVWQHQPSGVHPWLVQPMNIHDELECPVVPELAEAVEKTVNEFVENMKSIIPLIGMKWKIGAKSWADK